jgi:hypothetical protein
MIEHNFQAAKRNHEPKNRLQFSIILQFFVVELVHDTMHENVNLLNLMQVPIPMLFLKQSHPERWDFQSMKENPILKKYKIVVILIALSSSLENKFTYHFNKVAETFALFMIIDC